MHRRFSSALVRRLGFVFVTALILLCPGCVVSIPQPSYHKVDQETPAFKEAAALEKKRLQEKGKSAARAEQLAVRKVSREIIQAEARQQAERAVPLAIALKAFERPRGCWAYTFTTTTRVGEKTTVEVARFDAFQPEERVWTLVSRDGQVPDDEAQANFRRATMQVWKRVRDRAAKRSAHKNSEEAQMWNMASSADLEIAGPDSAGHTTFTFLRRHGHFPLVGDIPSERKTYLTENVNSTVLRQTDTFLEPAAMLGGSIKFEIWDCSSDYVLIEPGLPPFLSRTKVHYHIHVFGHDTGEVESETVYSDYRQVKCYDDRFEVRMGEPNMMDFIPGKN